MQQAIVNSLSDVMRKSFRVVALLALALAARTAVSQAPIVLPYTMTTLVGPNALYSGTFPQACFTGSTNQAYSKWGDGCPAKYINVGTEPHDVRVDGLGNVYWLDDTTSSSVVIRKYNPRSGLETVYAGSSTASGVCSGADKYGDGCVASDNLANLTSDYNPSTNYPGFTQNLGGRGLGVAHNNDIYLATYSLDSIMKVSYNTHILNTAAGQNGSANRGYSGDGGPASSALMNSPRGAGPDANNNFYAADTGNNAIRMVSAGTGNISTVGGSGGSGGSANTAGYVDGAKATSQFSGPEDVQVDNNGNVYVADFGNQAIRALFNGSGSIPGVASPQSGYWYSVMGNTSKTGATYNNVPLPGTQVVGQFRKFSIDKYNNLYVADSGNDVVWFLDHTTGYARIIAGYKSTTTLATPLPSCATDSVGDGCPAVKTAVLYPSSDLGAAVDQFDNLYINDFEGASASNPTSRIREVINGQNFGTVAAGNSPQQVIEVHLYPVGGVSSGAADSLAAGSPTLTGNADFTIVSTSAATVNTDNTVDYLITVQFKPTRPGLETASLKVTTASGLSSVFPVTGTGAAPSVAIDPGAATLLPANATAAFSSPTGIYADAAGDAWIADSGNNRVYFFNAGTNSTTIIAGTGTAGYTGDGAAATAATLKAPTAVAVDATGNVFIADTGNNVIRRIDALTGFISTYAGGASSVCATATDTNGNGCPATQAILNAPAGLAFDASSNLYVADQTLIAGTPVNSIRVINSFGVITFVAGGTTSCATATDVYGDGCTGSGVLFSSPAGLSTDTNNNLYIADKGDNLIRELNLGSGIVTVLAGNGQAGGSVGTGSIATNSQLNGPTAVAVDAAANIYIADTGNHAIRLVTASTGLISTIAGINGSSGTGTVPGTAVQAQLKSPVGIAANGIGTLIIADTGNARVLIDNRTQTTYAFGRTNKGSSSVAIPFSEIGTGTSTAILGTPLFSVSSTNGFTNYFTLLPSTTSGCSAGTVLTTGATCGLVGQFSPAASTYPTTVQAAYAESSTTSNNPTTPTITLTGLSLVLTSTATAISQTTPAGNANPQYGGTLVLQATVNPSTCNPSLTACSTTGPSGTVTFTVDGNSLAALTLTAGATVTSSSTASQTITGLSVGQHTVVVNYSGDLYFASSSSSTQTITVVTANTTSVVVVSPAASQQFTTTTFTATVASATTGTPTGTVTFYSNGTAVGTGTLNSSGVATFTEQVLLNPDGTISSNTTQLPGTYNITASYGGDSNFNPSTSSAATLAVTADAASLQLVGKSCNVPVQEFNNVGVVGLPTPKVACLNDDSEPTSTSVPPMGQNFTISGGVATPASGGTAGGSITAYEICPTASTSASTCTTSSTLDPNTFIPFVTFTESNSFTAGQKVFVSGITGANHIVLNVEYTIVTASSTSWTAALYPYAGVGQGSSVDNTIFVRASNTLSGTLTFSCSGLPANANCTFNPTSLTLTPGTAPPSYVPVVVTFWTDLQPGSGGTSSMRRPGIGGRSTTRIAFALIGLGLVGVFRLRRKGSIRTLTLVALLLIATGSSLLFTGCANGPGDYSPNFTPAGVYPVTVTVTNGSVSQSEPITFTVYGPGVNGAE